MDLVKNDSTVNYVPFQLDAARPDKPMALALIGFSPGANWLAQIIKILRRKLQWHRVQLERSQVRLAPFLACDLNTS